MLVQARFRDEDIDEALQRSRFDRQFSGYQRELAAIALDPPPELLTLLRSKNVERQKPHVVVKRLGRFVGGQVVNLVPQFQTAA